jgi:glycosyltransferase involved in cell wall biosynthesis
MPTPLISVVMPVYNCRPFVNQAIESVLNQTLPYFEFIIVDDGSTDGTREVVEQWAARDRRIRLISRPNTGIVGALNDGLAAAGAPLIARMDGDDISLPDRFEKQVRYLNDHPECVLLGTHVLLVDHDGDPIRPWGREVTHEEIDHAHLDYQWPVFHPSVMMRASAVRHVGGYRRECEWLEDLDLFLRLAEVGRLANLPERLVHYRKHPDSVCHTRQAEQRELKERIYAETHRRRGEAYQPREPQQHDHNVLAEQKRWAWWALGAGYVRTARKYARSVVRQAPYDRESWRLMYCAVRGH